MIVLTYKLLEVHVQRFLFMISLSLSLVAQLFSVVELLLLGMANL